MFAVPKDHPEIQRLEGKYKKWVSVHQLLPYIQHQHGWLGDETCNCITKQVLHLFLALPHDCSQGGLKEGMIVELANMSLASVLEITDTAVKLDANNMMAGGCFAFE